MPRTSQLSFIAWAVIAASLGACSGPRPEDAVLVRLMGADGKNAQGFVPQTDLSLQSAWLARAAGPADLLAWSFYVPSAAATLAAQGGGIDLGPLGESRYLVWTGHLAAGTVDVLRLRFERPLTEHVELYWSGKGEDFAPQRYLLQTPDPDDPRAVSFQVGPSRHWRGTVTRIGLRLLNQPVAGQALQQAEGLRYVAPEALGAGEARGVALGGGRQMQSWLARPGSSIERQLEVPRKARLRLHAAPWLPNEGAVKIRVIARGRRGDQVLLDRELRQASDPPRRRWTALEADLGDLAGETIDLIFETGPAPRGSLVMWGNPQIVGEAAESRPNVVLISLDTVRADHLSLYGYRRPTTPNLEAWARRWATVFETTVASAPWTLPSHTSMFSGVDAVHHGVNKNGPIPLSMTLVPQRFHDAGYATYATTAGVLLTPELGFARGFDEFRVRGRMESLPEWDVELGLGVTDVLQWLEAHRGERFFLFLHTFEAHSPYQAREPFFSALGGDPKDLNKGQPVWMEEAGFEADVRPLYRLFHPPTYADGVTYPKRDLQPQDREVARALYDSGLAYIDRQLSRLFEYLESEGLQENTIVVVTSDHGEALYEHGLVGHSSLYDHDLLVPLVLSAPIDSARGLRVPQQVRSVDIAPTLVELAGLPKLERIDGKSLVPFLRGETEAPRDAWSYALSTTRGVSLRSGSRQLKLILQDTLFDPFRGLLESYDLRSDPGETRNLPLGAAAERSRQRLRQEIVPGGRAIQIRIANAGSHEISGEISGSTVDFMATSPDLSFPCCVASPTGIRFHAPAGASYTVSMQDRSSGTLQLKAVADGQVWKQTFPVTKIPGRLRVLWKEGRWQTDGGAAQAGGWTGIEVQREGLRNDPAPVSEEEMLRKLRALGYVR